jgi:hypothetical protein
LVVRRIFHEAFDAFTPSTEAKQGDVCIRDNKEADGVEVVYL